MTELKLDPRNARKHSDRNKRQIKQSLETVGAGRSILADADGIVRAGNGVFAEWGDKPVKIVPTDGTELVVVQRTDLRGQDAIRAAALDNLVADSSAFDYDAAILAEIARDDDVIRAIANEDAKLRELLRKENGTAEKVDAGELIDKAAQLQEKWMVRRGDVWQVGKHRLMCGDSTNKEDVERLMDGKRAQLCVTSPPYFVGKDYEKNKSWDDFCELISLFPRISLIALDDNAFAFVNFGEVYNHPILSWELIWGAFTRAGFRFFDFRVWYRPSNNPIYTATQPRSNNEIEFLHTYVMGKPSMVVRDFSISHKCLWQTGQPERLGHAAAFSVELPINAIRIYTYDGALVYEPFLGSGTTLVACEQTGRIGYGMEIEPKYCAVSLERLANLGLQPQRLSDG